MQGFDCSSPDPEESVLIEAANKVADDMGHEMKLSSLEDFMNECEKKLRIRKLLTGESRNPGATGKWTNLMGDVISSRTKIKRRNAQCEVALQRLQNLFQCLG